MAHEGVNPGPPGVSRSFAKISIDPKCFELTADLFRIYIYIYLNRHKKSATPIAACVGGDYRGRWTVITVGPLYLYV